MTVITEPDHPGQTGTKLFRVHRRGPGRTRVGLDATTEHFDGTGVYSDLAPDTARDLAKALLNAADDINPPKPPEPPTPNLSLLGIEENLEATLDYVECLNSRPGNTTPGSWKNWSTVLGLLGSARMSVSTAIKLTDVIAEGEPGGR